MAAVYEAKAGNGKEEALGEVNVVTMNDNASYKIQIYTDITDPSDPEAVQLHMRHLMNLNSRSPECRRLQCRKWF